LTSCSRAIFSSAKHVTISQRAAGRTVHARSGVAFLTDMLGDLLERAGDVAPEVAEMGVDRRPGARRRGWRRLGSFAAAFSMSVVRCASIRSDQRVAADGAGGEVLRLRVERDGKAYAPRAP
jgi:hypothetical protein